MVWYLSRGEKMWGPLEEAAVLRGIAERTYGPGMLVREESGAWQPIESSIFGAVLASPASPVAASKAAKATGPVFVLASLVLLGLLAAMAFALGRDEDTPSGAAAEPLAAAVPEPAVPTINDRVDAAESLSQALLLLSPHMGDVTDGTTHPAAATLALWASKKLRWADLEFMADMRRADVMKDPDAHRGRKLCAQGSVIEIRADNTVNPPVFLGGLMTASYDMVRFIAVRSTGDLVQGSVGRFCGIITGLESYANAAGGTTHAVFTVGMFDLPENRL